MIRGYPLSQVWSSNFLQHKEHANGLNLLSHSHMWRGHFLCSNPENNVLIKRNSLVKQEQTDEHKLLSIFIVIYGDVHGHHEKVGHHKWLGKAQVQQQNKPTHPKKG